MDITDEQIMKKDYSCQRPDYICGTCGYKIIDRKCPCIVQKPLNNKSAFKYKEIVKHIK